MLSFFISLPQTLSINIEIFSKYNFKIYLLALRAAKTSIDDPDNQMSFLHITVRSKLRRSVMSVDTFNYHNCNLFVNVHGAL